MRFIDSGQKKDYIICGKNHITVFSGRIVVRGGEGMNEENNAQTIALNNGLVCIGIAPGEGLTAIRDLSSGINYISGDAGGRSPLFMLAFSETLAVEPVIPTGMRSFST
jgi:hypothetical protein